MKRNEKNKRGSGKNNQENSLRGKTDPGQRKQNTNAYQEAEKDINADPEFSARNPNDDLDEGETARLGEDTDLV